MTTYSTADEVCHPNDGSPSVENLPLVYVVILNWNGCTDTAECLKTCLTNRYPRTRIVVVDNGSSDGSELLLRSGFPEITILQTGSNLGYAGGNNVGIRHALDSGADYVVLLNNDTVVDPEFITALVKIATADYRLGMFCSKILFHDSPNVIWFAGATLHPILGWNHHLGHGQVDDGQYDQVVETDRPTGCAMMVSRQLCETIGLLREEMFCYAEDVDWGLRARSANYKVIYVPASKVWHKVTRSTGGVASPLSQYYSLRNMLLCLDLNLPLVFPLRVFRYVTVIGPYMTTALRLPGPRFRRLLAVIKGASHYFLGRFGPLDEPTP